MTVELILGDCLEVMKGMDDNSVDAVITDPPYFKFKSDAWDNQWDDRKKFIEWIGKLSEQWERIIKPNGSLYVFASPQMAAHVEVKIGELFNILNRIVWRKEQTRHKSAHKEGLRNFFPQTENIIFAEHYGADNIAKGEAGYQAKCDKLRGFVFEPIRAYLDGEKKRAGAKSQEIQDWFYRHGYPKYVTERHSFSTSQWELPTKENYERLRRCFSELNHNGEYLRREYEDLRREYEDLRRPFNVTADVPYTDVWDFPTVSFYYGKHPCQKPVNMMRHIINTSTKPNAVVLDCFVGSGTTGVACVQTGRNFIGIEIEPKYFAIAEKRIREAQQQMSLPLGQE